MESTVSYKYYIALDQEDGSTLYLSNDGYRKEWSGFRRNGRNWAYPDPAKEKLAEYKIQGDVPPNARVLKVKTTVEEVK
jgi:hypothetical protein